MNWEQLAGEIVRAVRGARTQKALSRALGYRSNVVFAWESGRDAPGAEKFFRMLVTLRNPPRKVLERFGRGVPVECPSTRAGLAEWLRLLAGGRKNQEIAERLAVDRYAVGRWLRGDTEMPLPVLLEFVELTTLSVVDFVSTFTDPKEVPSIAETFTKMEAARRAARELPWSHAIVHMVGLPAYRTLPRHVPGWFASKLGISISDEARCLELLVGMGRLTENEGRYEPTAALTVDTRSDPEATRRLASFWMREGAERVLTPGAGRFAFNTFAISASDFERLREIQGRYFAELRALVAASESTEVVAVATFQLFALAGTERMAPAQNPRQSPKEPEKFLNAPADEGELRSKKRAPKASSKARREDR